MSTDWSIRRVDCNESEHEDKRRNIRVLLERVRDARTKLEAAEAQCRAYEATNRHLLGPGDCHFFRNDVRNELCSRERELADALLELLPVIQDESKSMQERERALARFFGQDD